MPGIIAFQRRWSVGSDDLVVPGLFLFTIHLIWLVVLSIILTVVEFDMEVESISLLWQHMIGYLIVIVASLLLELMISLTALRGSILDTEQRKSIPNLIYIRLGVLCIEIVWLIIGGIWISRYYRDCPLSTAKDVLLGLVVCSWFVILSFFITLWCTFDPAGRSWVKMMNYQRSMKASESRFQYRRSGSCTRTWRHRKVLRAYQNSWDQRCRLLFCCMRHSDRSQNSFGDIARLLSDFFRDIDVVPSDVVAGLILLRKYQKIERESIVKQRLNDTYEYLSGVAVTSGTQFLPLNDPVYYGFFQDVIHYMTFALGAYGWPMYVMNNPAAAVCRLCANLRCSCFPCGWRTSEQNSPTIIKDNCCQCNYAALKQQVETKDVKIVYATFHVDVGITPFFVAVDYSRKKIIVSIRGTLSMQDVITDLNAEGEPIPINPPKEDWLGHTGMIQVAVHIQKKLVEESILDQAFNFNVQRGTQDFKLVIVGHSLGAGAAAILSILLRQQYPDVVCFSYSPPGGTLSLSAVEYTKSFITSVVVGKDVVPRIGLHQMESLRADLMHAIKRSKDPKWKTITCSVVCCGCTPLPTSAQELKADDSMQLQYKKEKNKAREFVYHSQVSNVALTSHQPLYPPGRIIHVVRHHTTRQEQRYESKWRQVIRKRKPVYQALWANNTDFDEVLISPVMIQDHMPENVLAALNKVVQYYKCERPMDRSGQSVVVPANVTRPNTTNGFATQSTRPEYLNEFERLFLCPLEKTITNPWEKGPNNIDHGDVVISCENEPLDDDDDDDDEEDDDYGECHGSNKGSKKKYLKEEPTDEELSPLSRNDKTPIQSSFWERAQVITTVGPRKPQRTVDYSNLEPEFHMESENSRLLHALPGSNSPKQATPAHKLQLETSFTSLLSPNDKSNCKISLQSFCSHSSNNTNTVTTNSLIKNESCFFRQMKGNESTLTKSIIVPWEYQSVMEDENQHKGREENGNDDIDFIHDDWFGLAPLATPESLSEVSSISSRASSVVIQQERGGSLLKDRFGHRRRCSSGGVGIRFTSKECVESERLVMRNPFAIRTNIDNSDSSDSYLDSPPLNRVAGNLRALPSIDSRKSSSGESSFLHYGMSSPEKNVQVPEDVERISPRTIRRTLRIPKDLATAYEDSYSNRKFEEMMKIRYDRYECGSYETNSTTSAKSSRDLEKSSTDLFVTSTSSSRDSVRYSTPEKYLENIENAKNQGKTPPADSAKKNKHQKQRTLTGRIESEEKVGDREEDINYHKPTQVILPTDENFPEIFSGRDASEFQYPYLETDFSLSDPDLTYTKCGEKNKRPDRKIRFDDERVESGVSFDQDYEFDMDPAENSRLMDVKGSSESSLRHIRDFRMKLEEKRVCDDASAPNERESQTQASQKSPSSNGKSKSSFSFRSSEALPLLANIAQQCSDKKRKYNFSFFSASKDESTV